MTLIDSEEFDKPWVLLCEGIGDQKFFMQLLEQHQIGQSFTVRVPKNGNKYTAAEIVLEDT
jgi:hypothetical protein